VAVSNAVGYAVAIYFLLAGVRQPFGGFRFLTERLLGVTGKSDFAVDAT
jgi:hypothetical protein